MVQSVCGWTSRGLFADHIEIQEGDLKYTRGVEFKKLIKERGVGDPGKHDNRVFRVAMHWFFKLGAIEKQELDAVERLYKLWGEVFLQTPTDFERVAGPRH